MNASRVNIAPVFPAWLIILLLCLCLSVAVIQYFVLRKRLGGRKAFVISLLRFGALILLACFAFNPSMTVRRAQAALPGIAILIDTSQTMGLPGRGGTGSRLDEAKALLLSGQRPLLQSLAEKFDVRIYTLGQSIKTVGVGEVTGVAAGGTEVDLPGALARLAGTHAAAVLLSDGSVKGEQNVPTGIPVIAVPVGDPTAYKDIGIKSVRGPGLAFRGREVAIDVTIRSRGYRNVAVPVLLKEGNRLLAAKNVQVTDNRSDVSVSLSFTPEEVGQRALAISIPLQPGESLTSNNRADFLLRVMRDKIRVLMVTGSPSPGYRFMRMALKDDPTIDLLSFVILRTPVNTMNVPVQEQSLIPFPVDTLFLQELQSFDLLIFDNFPFHHYVNPGHLEGIRAFVSAGGGFAMIGGADFSDDKNVVRSPIGVILPVQVPETEDYSRAHPSGVTLSKAGMVHPVTRLSPDSARNEKLWREMAQLDGFNLLKPKSTGSVLLESANGYPILTVGTYGKGRVVVLGTDYAWKWDMGTVAKGSDNGPYVRFIGHMIRWLTKDPGFDPVAISVQEGPLVTGQQAEVRITVREDGRPSGEALLLSVFGPDGVALRSKVRATSQPGEFVGSFLPEKKGAYRVRAETRAGAVDEVVAIREPLDELDAFPDQGWLNEVAKATGGRLVSDKEELIREIDAHTKGSRQLFTEEKHVPLWGTPYVVALLLVVLGLEWYLRRKWGLL